MSKKSSTPAAMRAAVGDVVIFREMHDPTDETTLHFVPAIVRAMTPSGEADLTVFGCVGKSGFRHNAARYSTSDEWSTWLTREEFYAANPDSASRRLAVASDTTGVPKPGIGIGSFVMLRHAEIDADAKGGAMGFESTVYNTVAIVRDIDVDGQLVLTVFTPAGVVDAGPRKFHRDAAGCWSTLGTSNLAGFIVKFRIPINTGRPAIDAIDNAAGHAPVWPAITVAVDHEGGRSLMVLTDSGVVYVPAAKCHAVDAGCWFAD